MSNRQSHSVIDAKEMGPFFGNLQLWTWSCPHELSISVHSTNHLAAEVVHQTTCCPTVDLFGELLLDSSSKGPPLPHRPSVPQMKCWANQSSHLCIGTSSPQPWVKLNLVYVTTDDWGSLTLHIGIPFWIEIMKTSPARLQSGKAFKHDKTRPWFCLTVGKQSLTKQGSTRWSGRASGLDKYSRSEPSSNCGVVILPQVGHTICPANNLRLVRYLQWSTSWRVLVQLLWIIQLYSTNVHTLPSINFLRILEDQEFTTNLFAGSATQVLE